MSGVKRKPLLQVLRARFPELSKDRLYSHLMCGDVQVDGGRIKDSSFKIPENAEIVISSKKYVSRGGYKLEAAFTSWDLVVQGKVALDAGASTGGFTDCMLQQGVRYVHAVDVGFNQLAFSLRQDDRVNNLESTNIMSITSLEPAPDFFVADLSFRSIKGVMPLLFSLSTEKWGIILVKPQFEVQQYVGFDGIVPVDKHKEILTDVIQAANEEGMIVRNIKPSPVKGGKGNQEYLFYVAIPDAHKKEEQRSSDELLSFLSSP